MKLLIHLGSRLVLPFAITIATAACGNDRQSRDLTFAIGGGPSIDASTDSGGGGESGTTGPIAPIEASVNVDDAGRDEQPIPVCGDGVIGPGEKCDDGNTTGGDGCTAACDAVEADYGCPTAGQPCISTVQCGDRVLKGTEQCDDGNRAAGDGCDSNCQLEMGWTCVPGGACLATRCGDGIVAGSEQCDDDNAIDGDGCSASCTLEGPLNGQADGWQCPIAGQSCIPTTCGNGILEGSEQCDDGNTSPFDGCSWNCRKEPSCGYDTAQADGGMGPYRCTAVCGDGMVFPGEDCDDGNTRDGDGCSHDCHVEPGYACPAERPTPPVPLYLPVVYRDFNPTHPQFEVNPAVTGLVDGRRQAGIALPAIGPNGKPVYNPAYVGFSSPPPGVSLGRPWTMDGPTQDAAGVVITDSQGQAFRSKTASNPATLLTPAQIAARYAQWYTDVPGTAADAGALPPVNQKFQNLLALNLIAPGTYQFDRSSSNLIPGQQSFFPLDGLGFGNVTFGVANSGHNFHFTSEVRYWFEYQGGERLEFRGDDDVWVFVNGRLSVDLGGIHAELRGIVTLGPDTVCVDDTPCVGAAACAVDPPCLPASFNLVPGTIYEIAVFQAERHITASNYKLTLSGFNSPRSVCRPICGDAIVVGNEACDLGAARNTGDYGTCNPDCTLPRRCGDAVVQADLGEQCDDGLNVTLYDGCAPGCVRHYCGDGQVQPPSEQCDDGTNAGAYGECAAGCVYGPRCGDSVVQAPMEQCDEGPNNGKGTCRVDCRLSMVK